MQVDRQTDKHTDRQTDRHTCSSQYLAAVCAAVTSSLTLYASDTSIKGLTVSGAGTQFTVDAVEVTWTVALVAQVVIDARSPIDART